jgi:nucleoside-diphosphate-sugar epimerase
MNHTKKKIVLCGQGRIGLPLSKKLQANNIDVEFARLDPKQGLVFKSEFDQPINLLVVAIANGQRGDKTPAWYWHEIYDGLIEQLDENLLQIENIVMVSSTRVYDGIQSGVVSAQTPAESSSDKGQQLIDAEKVLLRSSMKAKLLRCTGIYGEGYSQYEPIMREAKDRCYFGVDVNAIIQRLYECVKLSIEGNYVQGIELLTDDKVYYNGRELDFEQDLKQVLFLSQQFRILKSGRF